MCLCVCARVHMCVFKDRRDISKERFVVVVQLLSHV